MDKTMKILPLFIVVLLFSAAIIFSYIGWVAFRSTDEHLFNIRTKVPEQSHVLMGDGDINYSNLNEKKTADPRDPENEGLPPGLISVNEDVLLDHDLQRKIELLKMKVISKLRRHILNGAKVKGKKSKHLLVIGC